MLSIFRTNQFIANALLIFYTLLLRFSAFILPTDTPHSQSGLLSDRLLGMLEPASLIPQSLAIILIFLQALLINIIAARFRIAKSVSLFPGVFYILLTSCFPEFLRLSPVLIANTFLILIIYELLNSYKQYFASGNIYNAGLWLGLATLFYFSSLVFLGAIFIGFVIIRAFKLKEQIGLLLGLITPFWLVGIYYFVDNQSAVFWAGAFGQNIGFLDISISDNPINSLKPVFFGLLILIAIFSYRNYTYKGSIQSQKYIDVIFWFLAFSTGTLLLQANIQSDHLLLLAVPLSFLIGMSFLYMNSRIAEAFHFILLVGIFLLQFKPMWYIG